MRKGNLRSPIVLGVLLLAGVLLLPAALQAQTATGGIVGTVTDGTAPLPGASSCEFERNAARSRPRPVAGYGNDSGMRSPRTRIVISMRPMKQGPERGSLK